MCRPCGISMKTFSSGPVAKAIRKAANELSVEKPYHIVRTPIEGFGSLVSSASQYAVGLGFRCFKCSADWERQTSAHFERAGKAFRKGIREFLPTAAVVTCALWAVTRAVTWMQD